MNRIWYERKNVEGTEKYIQQISAFFFFFYNNDDHILQTNN